MDSLSGQQASQIVEGLVEYVSKAKWNELDFPQFNLLSLLYPTT
jgi:hypothetical protein